MIKPPRNSYGYRELLVYKKAEELQLALADYVSHFPHSTSRSTLRVSDPMGSGQAHSKTLSALSDQMERSARSTKQNITEGWKRNSTGEYYQFLGFAIASNAELEEDFTDVCKGVYEQKGLKGIYKGEEREKWEKWEKGGEMGQIEKIPFYPLNPLLPPCLRLKLRAKELNYLIDKLQKSLVVKMRQERTLSTAERIRINLQKEAIEREDRQKYLQEKGWG